MFDKTKKFYEESSLEEVTDHLKEIGVDFSQLDDPYKLINELADPKTKRWFWIDDLIVKVLCMYCKLKVKLFKLFKKR